MTRFRFAVAAVALAILTACSPYNAISEAHQIGAFLRQANVQAPDPAANPTHPTEHYTSYVGGRADRQGGPMSRADCQYTMAWDFNIQFPGGDRWAYAWTACGVSYFWQYGTLGGWVDP